FPPHLRSFPSRRSSDLRLLRPRPCRRPPPRRDRGGGDGLIATPMLISTSVPAVLRRAADQIAALPQPMVGRIEIHHALLAAGPTVQQAQAALDAIHTHLPPGDPGIDRSTHRRPRDQAAALLRPVADTAGPPAQQAHDALAAIPPHLPPGEPGIAGGAHRRHRGQAAALLRQVADTAATVPARAAVAGVLRAAERHVRGPVNASLRDALLT